MKVDTCQPFFCLFLMIPIRCFFNDSTTCPSFFIFRTKGWWSMFAEVGRNRKFFIMHFSMKLWNLRDLKEMSQRDKRASSACHIFSHPHTYATLQVIFLEKVASRYKLSYVLKLDNIHYTTIPLKSQINQSQWHLNSSRTSMSSEVCTWYKVKW